MKKASTAFKLSLVVGSIAMLAWILSGCASKAEPTPTETIGNEISTDTSSPSATQTIRPTVPLPTETPTIVPTPMGGSGKIAYCSEGKLYVLSLPDEKLLFSENCREANLSPDGKRLIYHEGRTLFFQILNTNENTSIDMPEPDTAFEGDPFPRFIWSPDSQRVAFIYRYGISALTLYITNPEFNDVTPVSQAIMQASLITWSADGHWLAFTSTSSKVEGLIYVYDVTESKLTLLNPFPKQRDQIMSLAWSPDSSKLLFTNAGAYRNSIPALYVIDRDGSNLTDVAHRVEIGESAWSPDGQKIAFCQGEYPDNYQVIMNLDGSDRIVFHEKSFVWCYGIFSSSGNYVLFPQEEKINNEYSYSFYSVGLESQQNIKLFPGWNALAMSPDGQWIAFVASEDKSLYLIRPDGTGLTAVTVTGPLSDLYLMQWVIP